MQVNGWEGLIGNNATFKRAIQWAKHIAPQRIPVLIMGEVGTGRSRLAQSIHHASGRQERKFHTLHCSNVPPGLDLVQNDILGRVSGYLGHGDKGCLGILQGIGEGTLFLYNIHEAPRELQTVLWEVLSQGRFRLQGSWAEVKLEARIIASATPDILKAPAQPKILAGLYYYLNRFTIDLPPLRERIEDIFPLAEHFMKKEGTEKQLSEEAKDLLLEHPWPGNVLELESCIQRALFLSGEEREIKPAHLVLPESLKAEGGLNIKNAVKELEADLIRKALARTGGNRSQAAKLLGLSPRALLYKIREYGIGD